MSDEQLDEYRQLMQQRYNQGASADDEQVAKRLQEEENRRLNERVRRDEEIAHKLQEQYAPNPPQYQQEAPPQYQQAAPPQHRPPPVSYPPASQPLLGSSRPDERMGCLPRVDDKCCGINAQVCVLSTAAVLTVGIFASLVVLAVG